MDASKQGTAIPLATYTVDYSSGGQRDIGQKSRSVKLNSYTRGDATRDSPRHTRDVRGQYQLVSTPTQSPSHAARGGKTHLAPGTRIDLLALQLL